MKHCLLSLLVLGLGLGSAPIALAGPMQVDNLTFTLSNNGALSGAPGSTHGWGFELTNTLNYVVITGSGFDATQNAGDVIYTDFIGPNFIVVGAPGSTVAQSFDPVAMLGVGSLAISPSASLGDIVSGQLVLTLDVYSVNPNDLTFDPIADLLASGQQISSNANVIVTPQPQSWLLVLSAIGLGLVLFRSRSDGGAA